MCFPPQQADPDINDTHPLCSAVNLLGGPNFTHFFRTTPLPAPFLLPVGQSLREQAAISTRIKYSKSVRNLFVPGSKKKKKKKVSTRFLKYGPWRNVSPGLGQGKGRGHFTRQGAAVCWSLKILAFKKQINLSL